LSVLAVVEPAAAPLLSFVGDGLLSREAEPLPFIVDFVPEAGVAELEPSRDVVLLMLDGEVGESEGDDVVSVLVLTPASAFGAEPLTLPLAAAL
jgi:hypothetical protein